MAQYLTTRRQQVREATTDEILTVADALLARGGTAAVSLRAIAREMGTAPAALYRYFAGVDELMAALCVRLFDRACLSLRGVSPWQARCREFRRWALANPREFGLMFGAPVGGQGCEPVAAERRAAEGALAAVLGDGLSPSACAQYCSRLCGLVAMEIFGHVDLVAEDPSALFEAELAAMSAFWEACGPGR